MVTQEGEKGPITRLFFHISKTVYLILTKFCDFNENYIGYVLKQRVQA